ncbi:MAG: YDG domain-containing protein, partial [Syntrophorhabdus sp.]
MDTICFISACIVVLNKEKPKGAFADKNVGTGKTVNVSDLTLTGNDAGNYKLTKDTATAKADITAKNLTATYTGSDKVYDGTTAAAVKRSLNGLIDGDMVTSSETATFADKNVGISKQINISGIALEGTDARNYNLQNNTATTNASITKAKLTVTANNDYKL